MSGLAYHSPSQWLQAYPVIAEIDAKISKLVALWDKLAVTPLKLYLGNPPRTLPHTNCLKKKKGFAVIIQSTKVLSAFVRLFFILSYYIYIARPSTVYTLLIILSCFNATYKFSLRNW